MEFQFLIRTLRRIFPIGTLLLLVSCEKDITVDLPETEHRVVVEASIETGQPPFILLTRTQNFFAPTSIASIAGTFITEADVRLFDGENEHVLDKICSASLPPELLGQVADLTGFQAGLLANANICIWTDIGFLTGDPSIVGENGRSYRLQIEADGRSLSAVTTIPQPVPLDSVWFRLAEQRPGDDSTGYIWARISDPDTIGNAYRWFARRMNAGPDGEPKDPRFVPPLFSVYNDDYVNGLSFDFNFNRGSLPYTEAEDEPLEVRGFFKRNDTVAVKFASIGNAEYEFFDSYANNVVTDGDVFSTPANIRSNIEGGLGIWVGYGVFLDTVICVP